MKTEQLIAMAAKQAAEQRQAGTSQPAGRIEQAEMEMMAASNVAPQPQPESQSQLQAPQQAPAGMAAVAAAQPSGSNLAAAATGDPAHRPLEPGQVPSMTTPIASTGQAATQPAAVPAPSSTPASTSAAMAAVGAATLAKNATAEMPAQPQTEKRHASAIESAKAAAAAQASGEQPSGKPAASPAPVAAAAPSGKAPINRSNWHEGVPVGNKSIASKGLIFVFGFLGIFFAWATLFPISSAVVAPGSVVSAGANKLIQHPVGGVVREIRLREGDQVNAGDVILILDPAISRAEFGRLEARQRLLRAQQARLESEAGKSQFDGLVNVAGQTLRGSQDSTNPSAEAPVLDPLLLEQMREFEAGRKRLLAEMEAAASQVKALEEDRLGFEAQRRGAQKLLNFTKGEIRKVEPLVIEGYLPKARLWDLEKAQFEQETSIASFTANISSTDQRIAEAQARLAQLSQADQEKKAEERTRVLAELAEIEDSILAAKTALESTELRAPVGGTLTKMTANTVGGVIKSGDTVVEIVPANSGLITEFRVPLHKIRSVAVGQDARVVVTAFNRRTYDPIMGEVIYVSADAEMDDATNESFFLARARLNEDPEKNNGLGEIQAGMTTEVYALSEPRVFLNYVLQPIFDSFSKAFRESN